LIWVEVIAADRGGVKPSAIGLALAALPAGSIHAACLIRGAAVRHDAVCVRAWRHARIEGTHHLLLALFVDAFFVTVAALEPFRIRVAATNRLGPSRAGDRDALVGLADFIVSAFAPAFSAVIEIGLDVGARRLPGVVRAALLVYLAALSIATERIGPVGGLPAVVKAVAAVPKVS
jgi:hypothetical protein